MGGVVVPAAKQKDDALTTVMKGLSIARDVYGIKGEMDRSAAQEQARKDEARGLVTPQQVVEMQKSHDLSANETPGSTKLFIRTPEGGETPLFASVRKKAEDPGVIAIDTVENGKRVTKLVEKTPGQSFIAPPQAPKEDKTPTQTADLRKEYNGQKTTQNTYQVIEGYNKLRSAAEVQNPTPADDMSLVYGFMKMQDPGSTVREGEYASAENTRGIPDAVLNAYNKAIKGQKLDDTQRANFLRSAEGILDSQLQAQEAVDKRYSDIAAKFKVDPAYVVDASFDSTKKSLADTREKRKTFAPGSNQPPAPPPPKVGDEVDGYVFKGGNPANPENWVQTLNKPSSIGTAESILRRP